ncbi:MAG: hypothetical protein LUI13_12790 [Lachnospiraceae bacterium]|nr:hypothetical protein [Lachnospiraceae bacterium]
MDQIADVTVKLDLSLDTIEKRAYTVKTIVCRTETKRCERHINLRYGAEAIKYEEM